VTPYSAVRVHTDADPLDEGGESGGGALDGGGVVRGGQGAAIGAEDDGDGGDEGGDGPGILGEVDAQGGQAGARGGEGTPEGAAGASAPSCAVLTFVSAPGRGPAIGREREVLRVLVEDDAPQVV